MNNSFVMQMKKKTEKNEATLGFMISHDLRDKPMSIKQLCTKYNGNTKRGVEKAVKKLVLLNYVKKDGKDYVHVKFKDENKAVIDMQERIEKWLYFNQFEYGGVLPELMIDSMRRQLDLRDDTYFRKACDIVIKKLRLKIIRHGSQPRIEDGKILVETYRKE